jgi:Membrane bound FAD containing D-sorbitol dehydrogenase
MRQHEEMQVSKRSDACVLEIGAGATCPDRRELLTRLLAVALADAMFWPCGGATAEALPLGRDQFLALSAKLCAMQIKDEALADAIQNALVGRFAAKELKHIDSILESSSPQDADHQISRSGLGELAKSIVAVWYSGQVGAGEAARVLAYEDALAWPATGYAKAPGTCGIFGEWTAKPARAFDSGHRQ